LTIDPAKRVHEQLLAFLEGIFGLAEQCGGVVDDIDHVDDFRLVFDIVVEKAVDDGIAGTGQDAAIGSLLHFEFARRREGKAKRMADVGPPSCHRWRHRCR